MTKSIVATALTHARTELAKEKLKSKKLRAQVKELKLDKAYLYAQVSEYRRHIAQVKRDVYK